MHRPRPALVAPRDPLGPWRSLGVLGLVLGLLACAVFVAGCACALPHEHVQVLADDAERFVELWQLEHGFLVATSPPTLGLTPEQLERQRVMGERLVTRARLARRGLAAEGKATDSAMVDRGPEAPK